MDTDLSEKLTKKYRRKPENQNALTAEREALGLTRADVAALVHMDRATYTNIENAHDNDFEVPSPERFLELSRKLNAPEILDYYCYWHCPCETVPLLENESLDSVMSILLTQLLKMNNINNTLYNIIGDGYIAPNERQALKEILTILAGIAYSADSMKLLIVSQLVDSLQILFADGMVSEQERVKLGKILDMLEDLEFDPEYVNMLRARYLANGEDANVF